jgi:hypothetical protein
MALSGCGHTDLPRHPNPVPAAPRTEKPAVARRIDDVQALLPGPVATGRRGDFRLGNGEVALVVAGLGGPDAGAVLDGAARGGQDALRGVTPVLGRRRLRPPVFARLELEELGGAATIRLVGADARSPKIRLTHEYTLHPGSTVLRITTTVENRGDEVLLQYRVGDRIDWGQAVPFAPGIGRIPSGTPSLVWLAGWSDGAAYAYFHRGGAMGGALSLGQAEVVLETLEVAPGRRASVQRLLAVASGGQIAHLLPPILRTQDVTGGRLDLSVYSDSGDPLPGATLEIDRDNKPFTIGRTRDDGTASLTLPPGNYRVRGHTVDRTTPSTPAFIRRQQVSARALRSSPPSRLVYEAREVTGGGAHSVGRFPVKLTVTGVDGTPTPWLGPPSTSRGANTALCATGKGVLPLPPGRYRVAVSHGPLHTVHTETVALLPHAGASLTAELRSVVPPPGLGVDTGQRTLLSPGTGVTAKDRALSDLAEGLDVAVLADPVVGATAALPPLIAIRGVTHTSPRLGSVTVFPSPPTAEEVERLVEGKPAIGSAERVVELTGARRPGDGLFSRLELDPDDPSADAVPGAINTLRILDGQHPEDFDQLLEDWLALLRVGRMLVATGGSDSRSIYGGEAGYPRTYVMASREAGPSGVVRALLAGRAVVSSGPVVRLAVENVGPGGVVKLAPRRRRRAKKQPREVSVSVTVSAPEWISLDTLTLYVNGRTWQDPIPIPGRADGVRLKQTLRLPITGDSFVIAVARGTASLAPVVNSPGSPLPPLAVTNPVWIDSDGNGRYDPPR